MIRHPVYQQGHGFDGDFALLKLNRKLELDETESYLKPICLPDKEDLDRMADQLCIVSGWGNTVNGWFYIQIILQFLYSFTV